MPPARPLFNRSTLILLHFVFALSGAAGLGLQMAWTRLFSLGLGHEMPSTFGVVTVFFAGLAGGAAWAQRPQFKACNPLFQCARLEGIIALWAVTTVWIIPQAAALSWQILGPTPVRWLHWLTCFVIPAVSLLPATLAMGATLPTLERWVSVLKQDGGRLGPLYAVNTLGAVLGVAASVFLIQPFLGMSGAILFFAGLHIFCGLLLFQIGWSRSQPNTQWTEGASAAKENVDIGVGGSRLRLLLWATGLLGIGYEILATRLLGQVLENTVFTYAGILIAYLLATAVGAGLQNRLAPNARHSLPALLVAMAISLGLGGWVLRMSPEGYSILRSFLDGTSSGMLSAEFLVALAVMGPPAFIMGLLFSCLATAARRSETGLGRGLAWNLLGGAMAPALVGLGLFPWLGSRWTLFLLGFGYLGLLQRIGPRWWFGAAVAVVVLFQLPKDLHLQSPAPGGHILTLIEGPSDTVTTLQQADGNRILRVNNRFTMGGTASTLAERRHSHLPLLFHPAPRRALFLGVGTGISFAALGTHPSLVADGVELVPEVALVQSTFAPHNSLAPGLKLEIADARRFVRASRGSYDVVIADLFHPARDGAGGLYTKEHFEAVRARLEVGGIFCQWLPLFQLDLPTLKTITVTFLSVFPDADALLLRLNADTPVLGLIGGSGPLRFAPDLFQSRIANPVLKEALRPLALVEIWPVLGSWFADATWLRAFSLGAQINTDNHPIVLFQSPRTLAGPLPLGQTLLGPLLDRARAAPTELLAGATPDWRQRFIAYSEARDAYLRGLILEAEGNATGAEAFFLESVLRSPDFTSGYAQMLSRASLRGRSDPEGARRILDRLSALRPSQPVATELRRRLGL